MISELCHVWLLAGAFAVSVLLCAVTFRVQSSRARYPQMPPGPKGLPFIGNLSDFTKPYAWEHFKKRGEEYGDVISLTIFGYVFIILNSHSAIEDVVLNKRPSLFANRPSIPFSEMIGLEKHMILAQFGKTWRDRRRLANKYLRPAAIQGYRPVQESKAIAEMKRLMQDPENFVQHIRAYIGSVILSIVYGLDEEDHVDHFGRAARELKIYFTSALSPTMINIFPFLSKLPLWMLGPNVARLAQNVKQTTFEVMHKPFKITKDKVRNGTARMSLVRDALAELQEGDTENELAHIEAFGSIYNASLDTVRAFSSACRLTLTDMAKVTSKLTHFILAMLLHPSIQDKAREEINSFVGRGRLPTFDDRESLPYFDAVLSEVFRWRPVAPQGALHSATEDVFCNGYLIPKGAMVMGNLWAILHDPTSYPEPEIFKPERFLSSDGKFIEDQKLNYGFGFGIRRCPGRYLADEAGWIFAVVLLAGFEITPGEGGLEAVDGTYPREGITIQPLPFDCRITPRDEQARQLIEAA